MSSQLCTRYSFHSRSHPRDKYNNEVSPPCVVGFFFFFFSLTPSHREHNHLSLSVMGSGKVYQRKRHHNHSLSCWNRCLDKQAGTVCGELRKKTKHCFICLELVSFIDTFSQPLHGLVYDLQKYNPSHAAQGEQYCIKLSVIASQVTGYRCRYCTFFSCVSWSPIFPLE